MQAVISDAGHASQAALTGLPGRRTELDTMAAVSKTTSSLVAVPEYMSLNMHLGEPVAERTGSNSSFATYIDPAVVPLSYPVRPLSKHITKALGRDDE